MSIAPPRVPRLPRWFVSLVSLVVTWLVATPTAQAYPWMIRHGHKACLTCHADPSGAGLLTYMGRSEGDLTLRTRYSGPSETAGDSAGFLFGAVPEPDGFFFGGSVRNGVLSVRPETGPSSTQVLQMQADLKAQLEQGKLRAGVSLGVMAKGAQPAWVTRNPEGNLVSREHWVGVAWGDERPVLLRAGRINLPFGVRDSIHTLWVRQKTRTDINDSQQHGAAVAYTGEVLRGELMAIAGNYQVSPDAYRERGWSAFAEVALHRKVSAGVSTLGAWSRRDLFSRVGGGRMAHGGFVRAAPAKQLVVIAESDALVSMPNGGSTEVGHATMLMLDLEALQGLHVQLIGEATRSAASGARASTRAWAGLLWFFAPHADVRADVIEERLPAAPGEHMTVRSLLLQLHLYL